MNLALFFTRNVSLQMWVEMGLFDREKRLYEEHIHLGHLHKVYWLTYGQYDTDLAKNLKENNKLHQDIEILSMPRFFLGKWGKALYSFLMPFIHRRYLKSVDILKTNQIDGSWSAVISKILFKRPLILRAGYIVTELETIINKENKIRNKIFEVIEYITLKFADIIVVSSYHNKEYLTQKYKIQGKEIKVIHNFIDTNIFKEIPQKQYANRLIFIGRLTKEKNLFNLIDAISKTELILDIYGKGDLQDELQNFVKTKGATVNFKGTVSNNTLPSILNRYRYYILPSLFEGMPKTLLEAMACGCVCIGTDVAGINEVVEDGKTGFLAKGVDSESILITINKAIKLSNNAMISQAASRVQARFSLESICQKEQQIYCQI